MNRELTARVETPIAARRLRMCLADERWDDACGTSSTAPSGTTPSATVGPASDGFGQRVRAAVEAHLTDPAFGVAELAHILAMDRSHLYRRCRDVLGRTPSDEIREERLARGARLLVVGVETVTEVAYAVRFQSASYFCRCFREVYGVTPAEYRTPAERRRTTRARDRAA